MNQFVKLLIASSTKIKSVDTDKVIWVAKLSNCFFGVFCKNNVRLNYAIRFCAIIILLMINKVAKITFEKF